MATTSFGGTPVSTNGDLPTVGSTAPAFALAGTDLQDITNESLSGSRVVLNIFPSIDTPTCATSVRTFNKRASELDNTIVLCVSEDLPFAGARFCGAEGLDNVRVGSAFRSDFSRDYGVRLEDGAFTGLSARAVVVIDEANTVTHVELVEDIANEPNYDAAIAALG